MTLKVKFRDKVTSLSAAADTVLHEMGYDWAASSQVQDCGGMYQGKSLRDLRYEKE